MKRIVTLSITLVVFGLLIGGVGSAMASTAEQPGSVADDPIRFAENDTSADDENDTVSGDTNETEAKPETNEPSDGSETNETTDGSETNETDETTVSPGARLSGVIGVHAAELDGAVSERAFGLSVAAAVSNGSKARVIDNQTTHLKTRLGALENETEAVETAYENGSISNATYHARAATLSARSNSLEQMINRTIDETERLPAAVRAAHGVNRTRLVALHNATGNATGQEIAAIARGIAGPSPGMMPGVRGPPAHAGPVMGPPTNQTPGTPGNMSQGPPENMSHGPPENRTVGPSNNSTIGPPENVTMGPPDNRSTGPRNDSSMGPPDDHTQGSPSDRSEDSGNDKSVGQGGPPSETGSPLNSPGNIR